MSKILSENSTAQLRRKKSKQTHQNKLKNIMEMPNLTPERVGLSVETMAFIEAEAAKERDEFVRACKEYWAKEEERRKNKKAKKKLKKQKKLLNNKLES